MSTTLSDLETRVQSLIRDKTGGFVSSDDIKESANRGLRFLQSELGLHSSKNRYDFDVFPNVYEYPLPTDFHDPITIQERGEPINFYAKSPDEFWLRINEEDRTFAVDSVLGNKFLLVNYGSAGSSKLLHNCDSLTDNGSWTADATTDALNLTLDEINEKKGSGCLNFDFDVSQSANNYASIYNSDMDAVDLSDEEDAGTIFLYVNIPDSTYISSVTVYWGSSASAYWSGSATTQYNGAAFRNGWNRIGVAWATATETGSPDSSSVDYLSVRITYSSSQTDDTDFLIDDIRCETPEKLELHYYSTYVVQSAAGTNQAAFSATDDLLLLEDQEADLLLYYILQDAHMLKEQFSEMGVAQARFTQALQNYKIRYLSERSRPTRRYY